MIPTDVSATPRTGRLRIDIAPGFLATIDGTRVDDDLWGRRQKPRMVLAYLVAAGGRVDRHELVHSLWPDQMTEMDTARAFAVILSVARRAIDAGSKQLDGGEGRSLLLHANELELVLGPDDSTDVQGLAALVDRLSSPVELSGSELQDGARALLPMMVRTPLSEFGRCVLAETLVEGLHRDVAVAGRLLIERWQELPGGAEAPAEVLAVAEMACASDCTDESMAAAAIQLHARARGKAAASRIYHQYYMAVRSELGAAPSSRLVDLHADIMVASR